MASRLQYIPSDLTLSYQKRFIFRLSVECYVESVLQNLIAQNNTVRLVRFIFAVFDGSACTRRPIGSFDRRSTGFDRFPCYYDLLEKTQTRHKKTQPTPQQMPAQKLECLP